MLARWRFSCLWCVLCLLVVGCGFSSAQVVVEGRVTDPAGAVVAQVPIHLEGIDRPSTQSAVSDDKGVFRLDAVLPGHYRLVIAAQNGFEAFAKEIAVGRTAPPPLTIMLALAAVQQQTTVQAGQGSLSTDPGENQDQVVTNANTLAHLPVLDQNFLSVLIPFLDPASVATSGVSIIVDGVEMKGTGVSASAIQEARINNDPYSVETNVPGKGRIEIMTKPATSQLHGEFNFGFRDSATDAANYFALTRPQEQKRIYEGSITGPVVPGTRTTFLISGTRQEDDLEAVVHALGPDGLVSANIPTPMRDTEIAVRATHDFSDYHRASFQYNVSDVITRNQGVGGIVQGQTGVNAQAREDDLILNDRLIISPTLLNQFMLLLEKDHDPTRSVLAAPKIVIDGSSISGGAQADLLTTENNMKVNDIVSWSHGRHYLKFGVNVPNVSRRAWEDHSNQLGTFSFSSLAAYNSATPYSFTQQAGPGRAVYWWIETGAFFQDQIRVNSHLQASFGLRYDWQTYFPSSHDLAPRASLIYSPGNHKMVIRAGAGVFYDRSGAVPIADLKRFNGVVLRSYTVLNPGYPSPLPPGASASDLPTNLVTLAPASHMPYTTHYSVGAEHQLRQNASVAVTYHGLVGEDLFVSRDINAPLPPDYLIIPNPQYGVVRQIQFTGYQVQNAVDFTLHGRIDRWFSGMAQYTWSHTSNDTGGVAWFPANQYNNSGEYARADFDQRHRFNLLGVINEGHWANLGLNLNLYSGTPYTETSGVDTYRTGLLNARPAGVARNTLQGAGYADLDARWTRDFFFSRSRKDDAPHLSFSVDSFNLPNHTNFSSYIGNVQSAFYQRPTAALPARRFQITAGITF